MLSTPIIEGIPADKLGWVLPAKTPEQIAADKGASDEREANRQRARQERIAAARLHPDFGTTEAGMVVGRPDDFGTIHVYGWAATREQLDALIASYRTEHAVCEPSPAFYDIQPYEHGGFHVSGFHGRNPYK